MIIANHRLATNGSILLILISWRDERDPSEL
jgi:hypothetical protein